MQGFFRRNRKRLQSDLISDKIAVRRYDATLNDDEPFFFNIKEDAQGEVLIQSGERLKHVRIYITSKKLMRNAEKRGVHHYDGTYKLSYKVVIVQISYSTNSPTESFNSTLKREFFKRSRLSVFGCLTKLEEVIKYYSSIHIIFHSLPKYQERLQKLSFDYTTESFVKTNIYTYEVCSRYLIKLKKNSCSCWYFSKWGICKHAMAFSNVYDLS